MSRWTVLWFTENLRLQVSLSAGRTGGGDPLVADQCRHPCGSGQSVHLEGGRTAGGHPRQCAVLPAVLQMAVPAGCVLCAAEQGVAVPDACGYEQMRILRRLCKMDVDITKSPNHAECIRCGMCMKACPTDEICYRFGFGDLSKQQTKE